MPVKEERIKYILEGEDKASGVFQKLSGNVQAVGKTILGVGAAIGTAAIGAGAGLVQLAADSEPLIGVRKAFMDLTSDVEGGGARMLATLQEQSHGWITNADLMMAYNQASSLVGEDFARKLPDAMGYLSKVAASTGMDMNYMLDSLVRGVGRMSPLVLDNLGIQVDLAQATERAAEMFDKEADDLSKAEQQAGMMNVIMEKLAINTEKIELPEKSFASFGVTLANIREELGMKLVPLLSPFAKVLSKIATVVGEWLAKALEKVGPLVEKVGDAFGWLFDMLSNLGIGELFAEFEDGSSVMQSFLEKLGFAEDTARTVADLFLGLHEAVQIFLWAITGDELLDWNEAGNRAPEWLRDATYWISNLALDIKELIQPIVDWIKENVELKDVLMAIGIAVAAFVLPILWAILSAVAPIIAGFAALVLIITLVRKAWEEDWMGIRTALTEAWENTIRPALETLWAWLKEKIPEAIATLKKFWEEKLLPAIKTVWEWVKDNVFPIIEQLWAWLKEKIPEAIAALKKFWEEKLLPALVAVWEFIRDKVIPALVDVFNWLKEKVPEAIQRCKDFWENKLKPALETVWEFIQDKVIPIIEKVVDWLKEKIPEAIATCKDFWENKLKPAIETVWGFIDEHVLPLFRELEEFISTVLNLALEICAGLWENVLKPALEKVWEVIETKVLPVVKDIVEWFRDKIGPAVDTAKAALDPLHGVLDAIGGALDWVKGLIHDVTQKLKNIKLPDWLVGHSPSPFEKTLAGVHVGLADINRELAQADVLYRRLERFSLAPMTSPVANYGQPAYGAAPGGYAGDRNYSLTIVTSAGPGRLEEEFGLMESWAGV